MYPGEVMGIAQGRTISSWDPKQQPQAAYLSMLESPCAGAVHEYNDVLGAIKQRIPAELSGALVPDPDDGHQLWEFLGPEW